ncbi:MAG: PQQ-like beta-propeller repeat protein [Bacteroidales bacterium]|nr:PQQ-like beta-propeller repeat protein [Bacteroidales bacterium]
MKQFITILLISTLSSMICFSQTVNQFRGANRDGYFQSKNLLKQWPADGLKIIWKNDSVGNGYGSPVIAGSQILINGEADSTGFLYCLDLIGKLNWKVPYGREWIYTFPGSRSTPTVVGDLVYVTSGMGNLSCFNLKDGSKSWSVSMRKLLHGRYTYHGHAESPLLVDDKVIIVPGGMDTNVVALNRISGSIEWICKGKGEIPGYNSPILIQLPARKIIITFTAYHMLGIDASNGELLWSHEQINTAPEERKIGIGDTHSNSAYYKDGYIYYIAGDGNGAVKLRLSEDGKTISQVWRNPVIDNYMGGFIILGDKIYTASDSRKSLLILNNNNGQILDSLKVGCGVISWADDLLYYYNQRGEVKLIKPAEKMEVISSMKVAHGTKEHFSLPVIENGILYIRHGKSLIAYSIQQQ